MSTDLVVSRLSRAVTLLSQAKSAQDAKAVADLARAAEVYAQRQKLGDEAESWARSIRLQAERLLGEFLKGSGGPRRGGSKYREGTLKPLGLTKKESARAQKLAEMPVEEFERLRTGPQQEAGRKKNRTSDEIALIFWEAHSESIVEAAEDVEARNDLLPETRKQIWKFALAIKRGLNRLKPQGAK